MPAAESGVQLFGFPIEYIVSFVGLIGVLWYWRLENKKDADTRNQSLVIELSQERDYNRDLTDKLHGTLLKNIETNIALKNVIEQTLKKVA
jgi:hypothetical protein